MQSTNTPYSHADSIARIDEILDSSDNDYSEAKSIPSRDSLTFKNGFYANCTALFIDLRDSAELPKKHSRPRLAKIYRAYISECVAVINASDHCSEVSIHGDAVWGVFDTPYKTGINNVFGTAARLNSLIKTLNCRLRKRGVDQVQAGIGMSYGRALMIKAGYKGSSINEVVWMGDVVNDAAHLSAHANKYPHKAIQVANVVYQNLTDHNKSLLQKNYTYDCYEGAVINNGMEEWWAKNCKA